MGAGVAGGFIAVGDGWGEAGMDWDGIAVGLRRVWAGAGVLSPLTSSWDGITVLVAVDEGMADKDVAIGVFVMDGFAVLGVEMQPVVVKARDMNRIQ